MTPLQKIAMGLVFLLVPVQFGATPAVVDGETVRSLGQPVLVYYDGLPNPVGWLLVLWGLVGLPTDFPRRRPLLIGSVLSFVVSLPLWLPAVQARSLVNPEFGWAASLPQGITLVLVCLALVSAPEEGFSLPLPAGRRYPDFGLRAAAVAFAAALAAPPLIFGGGLDWLALPAGAALGLATLYLIWTLFRLHRFVPPGVDEPGGRRSPRASP